MSAAFECVACNDADDGTGAGCDPGIADWLRRRRAAHRRPAPLEGPPLRAHAPPRRHSQAARARHRADRRRSRPTRARCERLRAAPFAVLHFAPPPSEGRDDPRTQRLIAALARARSIPQRFVYISTSGVYGDCAGARVDEMRPRRAQTPRARRRVAAEDRLRDWAKRYGVALVDPARAGHLRRDAPAARRG